MAYSESDDVDIIQLWCDKPCKREGCPGNSWETEAVTKRLTSLSTQYCEVIKLVGCSCSRDHTARSDSTQLVAEILNLFRLTRLTKNWTISVELSSKSDHVARRDVITLRTQLNSTASWVESGPVLWPGLYTNSVWRRVVGLQQLR